MTLYQAWFNYMTYESSDCVLSTHRTKQGARDVVAKELKKEHENHNKLYDYDLKEMPYAYGGFSAWGVSEIEVLD